MTACTGTALERDRLAGFAARVGVRCLAALLLALSLASPAAGDPPNVADSGGYTANGPVYSIARAGGRTYIGGDFTRVGLRSGPGAVLSAADGSRQVFPEVAGGEVRAVVSDGGGGWYIGGTFTFVGTQRHVALAHVKPDGSVDDQFNPAATLSDGTPATVNALAYSRTADPATPWTDDGTLYVGGSFARIGLGAGQSRFNLAALHGSDGSTIKEWSPVSDCSPKPGCSDTVRALAVAHLPMTVSGATQWVPAIFAGGDFQSAGVSGAPVNSGPLAALWGVGARDSNGDSIAGQVPSGDGRVASWLPYDNNSGTAVRALAVSPVAVGTCPGQAGCRAVAVYVAGSQTAGPLLQGQQFMITTPTGRSPSAASAFSKWLPAPRCDTAGCAPSVNAIALSGATLYFGGDFSKLNAGAAPAQRLASIPAIADPAQTNPAGGNTTASAFGTADGPVRALAASPDGKALFVGGDLSERLTALSTATQSPTGWAPRPDASALAIATDPSSPSSVYAGGRFSSLGSLARRGLAAFDSGGALLDWAPGVASSDAAKPPLVRALAASDSTVYIGGRFDGAVQGFDPTTGAGGATHPHANLAAVGADGSVLDGFQADASRTGDVPEVLSLSLLDSTLYVGGAFDHIGGADRRNIAAVDAGNGAPTGWNPGANDNVYALLPACGAVYAGGAFTQLGGQGRDRIGAIDPSSGAATDWNPSADGAVFALARSGPTIFAGGNFAIVGGQLRQRLAGLDVATGGATGLDGGGDGPVRSLAVTDATLYAGGTFTTLGTVARRNAAGLDLASGSTTGWDPSPPAPVRALAVGDDRLYMGGDFDSLGAAPQQGIASFTSGVGSPSPATSCAGPGTAGSSAVSSPAPRSSPSGAAAPRRTATVRRLSVRPTRVRRGRDLLTVRFTLSAPAQVRLRFYRRVMRTCPARRTSAASRLCRRYLRFADVTGRGHKGVNRLTFPRQRVGHRRLSLGSYRLTVAPMPVRAGARPPSADFSVVPR
jgi:hypothetical protein